MDRAPLDDLLPFGNFLEYISQQWRPFVFQLRTIEKQNRKHALKPAKLCLKSDSLNRKYFQFASTFVSDLWAFNSSSFLASSSAVCLSRTLTFIEIVCLHLFRQKKNVLGQKKWIYPTNSSNQMHFCILFIELGTCSPLRGHNVRFFIYIVRFLQPRFSLKTFAVYKTNSLWVICIRLCIRLLLYIFFQNWVTRRTPLGQTHKQHCAAFWK